MPLMHANRYDTSSRARTRLAIGVGLVLVVIVAFGVGRSTRASAPTPPVPTATAPAKPAVDATPPLAPGAQTRAGAANAAAVDDCVLGGPLVTTPSAYQAALTQILAPDKTAAATQLAAQESAQIDAQTGVVAAVAAGTRVYVGCVPLGYRVESFTSSTASVSVWTEQIVAVEGRYAPASAYITETLQLAWSGDAWKLESSDLLDTAWAPTPLEPALAQSTTLPAQLLTFTPYPGS